MSLRSARASSAPRRPTTAIAIVAAGVVSSVGGSAASTAAAVRSVLNDFRESDFVDELGQPVLGAAVPGCLLGWHDERDEGTTGGLHRLAAMFIRAATECAQQAGGIAPQRTALLLIGPEIMRPGISQAQLQRCFDALVTELGQPFHPASCITQVGTPGVVAALELSQSLLDESASGVDSILLAAADSLLNADDINHALFSEHLLTSTNSDGFIPGEACACVLLRRLADIPATVGTGADAARRPAVLRVAGLGLSSEAESLQAHAPARGRGLAVAIRQALQRAGAPAEQMARRLADCTAQSWFSEEASYAWSRVLRNRSVDGYEFSAPSGQVGHVGAAMGPLLLALALDAARQDVPTGDWSLVHYSSTALARGAVVLQAC